MIYLKALSTEFIKNKRSIALWLTLLYPLGCTFLVSLFLYGENNLPDNPWIPFVKHLNDTASFFLPFYLVFIISFQNYLEHRGNMWKHLYALPVPRRDIFLGKISIIFILLAFTYILFILFAYTAGFLLSFSKTNLVFQWSSIDASVFFKNFSRTYLSCFLLVAIQFWLSNHIRNIVFPVATGIFIIILPVGVLMVLGIARLINDPVIIKNVFTFNPYSFPFAHVFNFNPKINTANENIFTGTRILFFGLSIVVFALNYIDICRRNIK